MPHFVYEEVPNKKELCQGDVLDRTPELLAVLAEHHAYYAKQTDYKYFVVLTQSCDLVRRDNAPPKAPYINIAAARPIEQVLRREAEKHQEGWQIPTRVIGAGRTKNTLSMFLQRLFDNNEPDLFYLQEDRSLGIHQSCCAVLALSVALKARHYDMLLAAKLAQLKEPFQAKLGSLIGSMYNRVGTAEWDKEVPEVTCKQAAEKLLKDTFVVIADEQIKEGLANLKEQGGPQKEPQEILEHIRRTTVQPKSKKFMARAEEIIKENRQLRPINLIRGRASTEIRAGGVLKQAVAQALADAGVQEVDALAETLVRLFDDRMSQVLDDEKMPKRDEILLGFIRAILQDAKISKLLQ
jgi:hypothetical protein